VHKLAYGTRLTIAYTAIVALALVIFSFVAFAAVRITLAAQLQSRLQTMVTAEHSVPDVRHNRLLFDADDRVAFLGMLAQTHVNGLTATRDGRVLLSNLAHPPRAFVALASDATARSGEARIDGDTLVYRSDPIFSRGRHYGAVVVWASRALNVDVARTTLFTLLVATVVLIVVAALAGGILVRRMLRPVTDLSAMISDIEASDLSERLRWEGPDDELGRLCTTFDRLLDRLERAFDQQRRFTADASHELRTPLSVMRAELELALSRPRGDDEYRAILQRLRIESERLETLTESLLWAARHDAGKTDEKIVAVEALVERAVARIEPIASPAVRLVVDARSACFVRADAPVLERALVAILDNARRFSPPGGTIACTIDAVDATVDIRIADEGPGFTDAALRHATERFWRDDVSRSGPGTGLGLAIATTIVERHGGTLSLRNGARGGAVVTIALPRQSPGIENASVTFVDEEATVTATV
jgi:two-component system OmpR family sensor kinase